ncbi:MAG: hypothetical protein NVSMB1_23380 [Polyangiales bacterium]
MKELTVEREVVMRAVQRASDAVMAVYRTDFEVAYKNAAHDDPVTLADRLANDILVEAISSAFPDDPVVAEESAVPRDFESARRCWFVDPLDGTRDFVARNGEFCIMVGLAIEGHAVLGVVGVPALEGGFLLIGEVDGGNSFAARLDERGEHRLEVSTVSDATHARVVVSRSRRSKLLDRVFHDLGSAGEIRCGSVGVKIGKVVEGIADAYLHPASAGPEQDRRPG